MKDTLRMILTSASIGVGWALFIVLLGMVFKVATMLFLLGWRMFG